MKPTFYQNLINFFLKAAKQMSVVHTIYILNNDHILYKCSIEAAYESSVLSASVISQGSGKIRVLILQSFQSLDCSYTQIQYVPLSHKLTFFSKTCVKRPLKNRLLITNGILMNVKTIAECSLWSIMQYF